MEYLFVAIVEFFFQGNDNAVEVVDIVREVPGCKEFAGCSKQVVLSGKSVGQAFFQSDDIFSCSEGAVGDEYLSDLSGLNIVFPGEQTMFKILMHI